MSGEFTMRFDLGNDEFADDIGRRQGITRLLLDVSQRVNRGETVGTLFDVNGNRIGAWDFDECDEDPSQ